MATTLFPIIYIFFAALLIFSAGYGFTKPEAPVIKLLVGFFIGAGLSVLAFFLRRQSVVARVTNCLVLLVMIAVVLLAESEMPILMEVVGVLMVSVFVGFEVKELVSGFNKLL
ncbi:hypothetical protein ACJO5Y_15535 [Marinobacter sp. GN3S48]|uniref:hypothetical protein n=1 Tax=Marinobacter sp. GN3S48 TaxID=3382302 RepID=UPI00387B3A55